MLQNDLGPAFRLGQVTLTPAAKKLIRSADVFDALLLHMRGNRGGVTKDDDQFQLPFALDGCRLLGAYRATGGQKFLIVTEADRSRTTVMLPEEL